MAFSLRIGPMLVTADTAAEAAELVRALGGLPANEAAPPPDPPSQPAAVEATAIPAASAPPAKRKWAIGRGAIFKQESRFVLEISVEGKSDRRGSFKTREDAERAQEETYQARLRGDPLPVYVWRRCRRCGVVGHTAVKCKAPAAVERLDELPVDEASAHAPIWPDWAGGAPTMGEGREEPPPAVAIPAPVVSAPAPAAPAASGTTRRGTPEYRAKVADAVRASWARRRAARAATLTGEPLPPAVVTAKLPPRCGRCFRVGHVETECPTALLGDLADLLPAASHNSEQADDSSDLTDLVDVPDADPTVIPDVNLGVECHACGRRGHIMSSPDCPLTTKPGWSPEHGRALAEPRTKMPLSFTETPLTMRRHLHVIEPGAEPVDEQRPRTRGECQDQPRPCPWQGCRYHLALDVLETGNLHRTFGDMDLAEMPETCALDVADRDGATLEEIGRALNVSRERIRQIETLAIKSAKKNARRLGLRFEAPNEPRSNAPEDAL